MGIRMGNGEVTFDVIGITEDRKTIILEGGLSVRSKDAINVEHAVNMTGKSLPVLERVTVNGMPQWKEVGQIEPLKITIENLQESIMAHTQLQKHLMGVLKKTNYEGQGASDEKELKEHFEIAVVSMGKQLIEMQKKAIWEKAEEEAAKQGKIVKECPKCKSPTICGECGEETEFRNGTYLYFTKCQKCGHRFMVNSY